jgi:hypothetical protein
MPLVEHWQNKTGGTGLTDEAVFQHQKEVAQFMACLVNLMITETPLANLAQAIALAMQSAVETPVGELKTGLDDLFGDVSEFTAWETNRQIHATFEANPQVKMALSTSEVAALVEYEAQKQGWCGQAGRAVELLEASLTSELQNHIKGRSSKTVLQYALRSAGRRSLLLNLRDAIKGQLKSRLVEKCLDWLKKGDAQVARQWEFLKSPIGKENGNVIRDWLFRRR